MAQDGDNAPSAQNFKLLAWDAILRFYDMRRESIQTKQPNAAHRALARLDKEWGGELLIADVQGFERIAHLTSFKLIGGEAAIREPVRQLLGLLFESYGVEQIRALDIPAIKQLPLKRISNLHQLWQLGRNAPHTSSIGRLFDAVAALMAVAAAVALIHFKRGVVQVLAASAVVGLLFSLFL